MNALEKLKDATRMLGEVRSAIDAKKLMNMAAAAEYYARKAKLGATAINYAHTIKTDATKLLGGYLSTEPKATGTKGQLAGRDPSGGTQKEPPESTALVHVPTLAELGLTKKESTNAQLLHAIAAKAPELFEEVRNGKKSVVAVRRELQRAEVKQAAPLPAGKYRVFYADPPWKYSDQLTEDYGPTQFHYSSLTIAQLIDQPIKEMTADNAVLFLWVTSPLLESAFPVIKAWGFEYKTSFVWDKVKHNMGHYNSVRHEFLLVAVRGSCMPDIPKLYDSVVSIERTRHSAKPPEFRRMIDALYPHGKRVELFAREEIKGWKAWGNQVDASQTV